MRFTGRLQEWNEQRGFGFIRPVGGGDDVFVHVSALPPPPPGSEELLTFEIALDRQGRKKAIHVRRQALEMAALQGDRERGANRSARSRHARNRRHSGSRIASVLAAIGVLAAVGWFGYGIYGDLVTARLAERITESAAAPQAGKPTFACDGRTQCFQMRSCEEAKFFLQNCPDTTMDGDHDGIPCEQQWCTSWLR